MGRRGAVGCTSDVILEVVKNYPYCLVLIGSRNGFERDFIIELKLIEGLMA